MLISFPENEPVFLKHFPAYKWKSFRVGFTIATRHTAVRGIVFLPEKMDKICSSNCCILRKNSR